MDAPANPLIADVEQLIDMVFASAWQAAVQRNPMLLASHGTEKTIERARKRIAELLTGKCAVAEARERILAELLDPNSPLYKTSH